MAEKRVAAKNLREAAKKYNTQEATLEAELLRLSDEYQARRNRKLHGEKQVKRDLVKFVKSARRLRESLDDVPLGLFEVHGDSEDISRLTEALDAIAGRIDYYDGLSEQLKLRTDKQYAAEAWLECRMAQLYKNLTGEEAPRPHVGRGSDAKSLSGAFCEFLSDVIPHVRGMPSPNQVALIARKRPR